MKFQYTASSSNAKTGKIPTTMTERESCPPTCPFMKNGCYADNFPLSLHWDRVEKSGINETELFSTLSKLPAGQLWRHNVAGDLPHTNGNVDKGHAFSLAMIAAHTRPIIYSHHRLNGHNTRVFQIMRDRYHVNVNASCESKAAVESALDAGINAVMAVSADYSEKTAKTERGTRLITCPATYRDDVTCASCGLCSRDRVASRVAVVFPAHGARKKAASFAIRGVIA